MVVIFTEGKSRCYGAVQVVPGDMSVQVDGIQLKPQLFVDSLIYIVVVSRN